MFVPNYECFNCGEPATEKHHVVPKSMGGTRMVPLCSKCHSNVHDGLGMRRDQHTELTTRALNKKMAPQFYHVWWDYFKEGEDGKTVEELATDLETSVACIKKRIKRLQVMDTKFMEELFLPIMGEEYAGFSFFNLEPYCLSESDILKIIARTGKTEMEYYEECMKNIKEAA